jgi:excisionase family DNA binding protein
MLVVNLSPADLAILRRALTAEARRCRQDGTKLSPGLLEVLEMTRTANTGPPRPAVDLGHHPGDAGPVTPLAVDYEDAARMVGVSARQVRRLVASGALPVVHIGGPGSPRIRVKDLHTYLAAQVENPGEVAS